MLIVSHIVAGTVIAKAIPNPWLAAPLAFFSHFVLDMVPHAQAPTEDGYKPTKKTYFIVAMDIIASAVFLFFFKPGITSAVVITAAILPDILDLARYNKLLYKTFRPYFAFHDKVQNETNKPIGFITQIILIISAIVLLGALK